MAKKRKTRVVSRPKGKAGRRKKWSRLSDPGFWSKSGRLWAAAVIFSVAFALYLPVVNYDYILDDKIVISENNFVKEGVSGIWDILSRESFEGYLGEQQSLVVGSRYRPLSIVTFAIEYQFFGLNPTVGHIVNGLLYGLSCVLIYKLMFFFFRNEVRREVKWFFTIPFAAALLFAVHPLHTEVVANIKGRDEIMALLGALGALFFSVRYLDRFRAKWLVATGIVFFLGLMAKENVITFLAVIPMALYFFTDRPLKKQWPLLAVLLITTLVYLFVRFQVIGYLLSGGQEVTQLMNNPFVEMNSGQKFATIVLTLGKYIQLHFIPWPLSHDYYPYAIAIQEWSNPLVILSSLIYVAMAVYGILGLRKKILAAFWFLYFLATLSIVSNVFFPVGTLMNERFVYMSSLAFCALVPWLLMRKLPEIANDKRSVKYTSYGLLAIMLLTFTGITLNRLPDWKDPMTLNASAVKANPNSARANLFYGTANFNLYRDETDQEKRIMYLNVAEHHFERALEIHPTYSNALNMRAGVAAERYRIHRDIDRLLDEFAAVLKVNPRLSYIREYMEYLNRTYPDKQRLLDFYYEVCYEVFVDLGFLGEAHFYLNLAYELAPDNGRINYALGRVLEMRGMHEEAGPHLQRAQHFAPSLFIPDE